MDIIELLKNEIQRLMSEREECKPLNLVSAKNLTSAEAAELIEKYTINGNDKEGMNSIVSRAINKHIYNKKTVISFLKESLNENVDTSLLFSEYIINECIEQENLKRREEIKKISSKIKKINKVIELLNCNPNNVNFKFIKSTLIECDFEEERVDAFWMIQIELFVEKKKLIMEEELVKKMLEEQRKKEQLKKQEVKIEEDEVEELDKEEEFILKINNFDLVKDVFNKNKSLFPDRLYETNFQEGFSKPDLVQTLDLDAIDFEEDYFIYSLIGTFNLLNDAKSATAIEIINSHIDFFSRKYELYLNIISLQEDCQNTWRIFKDIDDKTAIKLTNIQDMINELKTRKFMNEEETNIIHNISQQLHSIKKDILFGNIKTGSKLPIKGFVLFDYDKNGKENKNTYITTDLDINSTKNLIDNSINGSRLLSGYNDFCELIDDILLFGKPKILLENTDKLARLVSPVYRPTKSGRIVRSLKYATGMLRIRPTRVSFVRFIDEKVEIMPNTKKMIQIKELLTSKYPGIEINESSPFTIYLNMSSGFKYDDFDAYNVPINRQESSELRVVLKNKKDIYDANELKIISEAIDMSMKTYSDLESISENFDFNIPRKIKHLTPNDD
ncbi:MAG: hypothetical protein IKF36_03195 [Bacilli bacterium]|nr:hypothetical protein [Bacilli bacterium]